MLRSSLHLFVRCTLLCTVLLGFSLTEAHAQRDQLVTVAGTVVDTTSTTPIPNAQVILTTPAGAYFTTTTDQNGNFILTGIPAGCYYVIVMLDGITIYSEWLCFYNDIYLMIETDAGDPYGEGGQNGFGKAETLGELPKTLMIGNYPNPFNPATTLTFALPEAAPVHIRIFDTAGRLVRDVVQRNFEAGTHTLRFDASGLPSGRYLYHLQTGTRTLTNTLVLSK